MTTDGGNFGESPRLLLNDTTCGIRKTPYNAGKYHGVSHGNMFSPPNFSMGGLNDSTLVASQQGGDDSEIWLGEKPMETTVRETGLLKLVLFILFFLANYELCF